jgi:hypothetical protein
MIRIPASLFLVPCSALILSGCYSTHDIQTYGDLSGAYHQSLRVMSVDMTVYDLSKFSFNDSLLRGEGKRLVAGRWLHFSGDLPMSRIVYIQTQNVNVFQTLLGLGLMGLTADAIVQSPGRGLSVYRRMGGDGLIGSCPYVYAWDGSAYVRQGEAFGTALGKGLETSTACLLPGASAEDREVRVRIADERPETHYINAVHVSAYEVPPGTPVSLDTRDRLWPLPSLLHPLVAPEAIMKRDNVWWRSLMPRRRGVYRDTLELILPVAAGAREGSFVVHAINTHLSDAAFRRLFGFLGDESLPYLYKIEHDTGTIRLLRGWIEECGLHVDVRQGGSWVRAGTISPEANEVPFTRLVRIPVPENAGDSLRVRLRVLADTWQIDDVAVDWSPARPLEEHILPLLGARHSSSGAVERSLQLRDSEYVRLIPGEYVDLRFRAFRPREGSSVVYACHAAGYLYEWFPDQPEAADGYDPFTLFGPSRIGVVESLLGNHDAFLSMLFDRPYTPPGKPR